MGLPPHGERSLHLNCLTVNVTLHLGSAHPAPCRCLDHRGPHCRPPSQTPPLTCLSFSEQPGLSLGTPGVCSYRLPGPAAHEMPPLLPCVQAWWASGSWQWPPGLTGEHRAFPLGASGQFLTVPLKADENGFVYSHFNCLYIS